MKIGMKLVSLNYYNLKKYYVNLEGFLKHDVCPLMNNEDWDDANFTKL